ncbi:MAG TPA: SipW-dependent-type signal peptide-containing protein, partial [Chloroflexota bacterium]|nr:SipW-dependent-type signal peptide-containing protein [Chloroflexota bacterium]
MSLFKKLMLTMLVVGSAGGIVGAGTFASFNASVTNSGNTFASGTVTLQTTQASGKTCTTSQAGGSNVSVSTGCTTSLFATATNVAAGDTYYGHIQLLNQG